MTGAWLPARCGPCGAGSPSTAPHLDAAASPLQQSHRPRPAWLGAPSQHPAKLRELRWWALLPASLRALALRRTLVLAAPHAPAPTAIQMGERGEDGHGVEAQTWGHIRKTVWRGGGLTEEEAVVADSQA